MTPAAFDYARPVTIAEARALLRPGAALLAGGQSLVPLMTRRLVRPDLVIDLNGVAGLAAIEETETHLRMGALVRLEQARTHPLVQRHLAVLAAALRHVANPAIRRRGTVVGNLVANTTGAELPTVAAALGAEFEITLANGESLRGPAGGALPAQALVTHVIWPRQAGPGGFCEISRREGHGVLVCAALSQTREGLRAAVGGLCATALPCPGTAALLAAHRPALPDQARLAQALAADRAGRPVHADHTAGAAYRDAMATEMLLRAAQALGQA